MTDFRSGPASAHIQSCPSRTKRPRFISRDRRSSSRDRRSNPRDRGSVSLELVLVTPLVLVLIVFVVFCGRLTRAEALVRAAAAAGARAASLRQSPGTARVDALQRGHYEPRRSPQHLPVTGGRGGRERSPTWRHRECRGVLQGPATRPGPAWRPGHTDGLGALGRGDRSAARRMTGPIDRSATRVIGRGHRPARRMVHPRGRGEAGFVSAFVVALTLACLMAAGLALDGGRLVAARVQVADVAGQAARAGAQQVVGVRAGHLELDPAAARSAAERVLSAAGASGHVAVGRLAVTVQAEEAEDLLLLRLVGLGRRTVTATATAQVEEG